MGPIHPILMPGRRDFLKLFGVAGVSLLTPIGTMLARAAEKEGPENAQSLIVLWMQGGPSQVCGGQFPQHDRRQVRLCEEKPVQGLDVEVQLAAGVEIALDHRGEGVDERAQGVVQDLAVQPALALEVVVDEGLVDACPARDPIDAGAVVAAGGELDDARLENAGPGVDAGRLLRSRRASVGNPKRHLPMGTESVAWLRT